MSEQRPAIPTDLEHDGADTKARLTEAKVRQIIGLLADRWGFIRNRKAIWRRRYNHPQNCRSQNPGSRYFDQPTFPTAGSTFNRKADRSPGPRNSPIVESGSHSTSCRARVQRRTIDY